MVVTTDLGPRGPCVWPTLMCRPAPGLKLSSLWASEVTADSTSSVWTSILCGSIIGVANLCVLTTFNLLFYGFPFGKTEISEVFLLSKVFFD